MTILHNCSEEISREKRTEQFYFYITDWSKKMKKKKEKKPVFLYIVIAVLALALAGLGILTFTSLNSLADLQSQVNDMQNTARDI